MGFIGSDHTAATVEKKEEDIFVAPSGSKEGVDCACETAFKYLMSVLWKEGKVKLKEEVIKLESPSEDVARAFYKYLPQKGNNSVG